MSITNAMYAGVSGLSAESGALGVVGDNVANTNTVGFKQSRALFEDVLGGAAGTRDALGAGVRMARAQQIFAQGTLLTTGQSSDLALSGDGFFVVHGTVDGLSGDFYTRAGQTSLDSTGTLVNGQGLALMGYKANADGSIGSQLGPVQVSTAALAPKPTKDIDITANLDSSAAPPLAAWDPLDPSGTSNFSTSITVYDSLGAAHSLDVYFRANGSGAWEYHTMANGAEVVGGQPGVQSEIAQGSLTFTPEGALQDSQLMVGGTVDWNNAQPQQALNFNFGNPISAGGTGFGGTTQFASPSAVSAQGQDGYASGALSGIQVDPSGVVNGVYTNGQKIAVAQLAIAKFASNEGLGRMGHNLWARTRESGEPLLGAAGTGGRASVSSGALEQSNVDIAQQFVDMISHQRAFQANSKTITTADEMLQNIVELKR
ncbi:MAG: flagellar hook protein FlgE [Polyangiaceae bacterium]